MRKKTIISDGNGNPLSKKILIFENINDMKILSNNIAWKIVEILSSRCYVPRTNSKGIKTLRSNSVLLY